jgi:hypothetical protein
MAYGPALTIMRYALIFAWTVRLAAGAEHDPAEVLRRMTQKVLAGAKHIPNCTCVETVNREYFRPAAATLPRQCDVLLELRRHPTLDMILRPFATDRLRLDVTMVGHGEIFSWVGASKFVDTGIDHVVRNGPIGTGFFGGYLMVIFETDAKKFTFESEIAVNGRSLFEYSFQVMKSDSHYKVRLDTSWIYVAYSGTFQVDPETDDLVRMTIQAADLPPATGECMSTTTMEFEMVRIGDDQFLLPRQSRQRFVSPNGDEAENTTGFTNCREYRGESTVNFFQEPQPQVGNRTIRVPATPPPLPLGSRFTFQLTIPIQSDTAAAGDLFSGRLVQPIRDLKERVLAPKGAIVEGHLVRVQSFRRPPEVYIVFRPEAVEIKGASVPLTAVRDWDREIAERRRRGLKGLEINLPLLGEDWAGVFRFSGEHVVIPKGFQSEWRTVPSSDSGRVPR